MCRLCMSYVCFVGEKTKEYMGVTETILSTSFSGVLFGLFSAQPMMILGATGPVLVFEESLYQVWSLVSKSYGSFYWQVLLTNPHLD